MLAASNAHPLHLARGYNRVLAPASTSYSEDDSATQGRSWGSQAMDRHKGSRLTKHDKNRTFQHVHSTDLQARGESRYKCAAMAETAKDGARGLRAVQRVERQARAHPMAVTKGENQRHRPDST